MSSDPDNLHPADTAAADALCAALATACPALARLEVVALPFTSSKAAAGLAAALRRLSRLTSLALVGCCLPRGSNNQEHGIIQAIASMPDLDCLIVASCQWSAAGTRGLVAALAMRPLCHLELTLGHGAEAKADVETIAALCQLSCLESLAVAGGALHHAAEHVAALFQLPQLRDLRMPAFGLARFQVRAALRCAALLNMLLLVCCASALCGGATSPLQQQG
jgi:hypothetical protein